MADRGGYDAELATQHSQLLDQRLSGLLCGPNGATDFRGLLPRSTHPNRVNEYGSLDDGEVGQLPPAQRWSNGLSSILPTGVQLEPKPLNLNIALPPLPPQQQQQQGQAAQQQQRQEKLVHEWLNLDAGRQQPTGGAAAAAAHSAQQQRQAGSKHAARASSQPPLAATQEQQQQQPVQAAAMPVPGNPLKIRLKLPGRASSREGSAERRTSPSPALPASSHPQQQKKHSQLMQAVRQLGAVPPLSPIPHNWAQVLESSSCPTQQPAAAAAARLHTPVDLPSSTSAGVKSPFDVPVGSTAAPAPVPAAAAAAAPLPSAVHQQQQQQEHQAVVPLAASTAALPEQKQQQQQQGMQQPASGQPAAVHSRKRSVSPPAAATATAAAAAVQGSQPAAAGAAAAAPPPLKRQRSSESPMASLARQNSLKRKGGVAAAAAAGELAAAAAAGPPGSLAESAAASPQFATPSATAGSPVGTSGSHAGSGSHHHHLADRSRMHASAAAAAAAAPHIAGAEQHQRPAPAAAAQQQQPAVPGWVAEAVEQRGEDSRLGVLGALLPEAMQAVGASGVPSSSLVHSLQEEGKKLKKFSEKKMRDGRPTHVSSMFLCQSCIKFLTVAAAMEGNPAKFSRESTSSMYSQTASLLDSCAHNASRAEGPAMITQAIALLASRLAAVARLRAVYCLRTDCQQQVAAFRSALEKGSGETYQRSSPTDSNTSTSISVPLDTNGGGKPAAAGSPVAAHAPLGLAAARRPQPPTPAGKGGAGSAQQQQVAAAGAAAGAGAAATPAVTLVGMPKPVLERQLVVVQHSQAVMTALSSFAKSGERLREYMGKAAAQSSVQGLKTAAATLLLSADAGMGPAGAILAYAKDALDAVMQMQ